MHYQRGCRLFYELIKLLVIITKGEDWRGNIKAELFKVNLNHSYFKEVNQENWSFLEVEVAVYYRRIFRDSEEE